MTELTLFDLNTSKNPVKELSTEETKLIMGGYPSGPGETGGGSDDVEDSDRDLDGVGDDISRPINA